MDVNALNASRVAAQFQTILDESGVSGVKVAASEDGKNLVVTSARADGTKVSTQIGVPDIDEPSPKGGADGELALEKMNQHLKEFVKGLGSATAEVLEKVAAKMEALAKQIQAAASGSPTAAVPASATGKSVMYTLYQLIALLLECAREQRQTARLQREADSQMMIKQMEAQCESMRSDAVAGLVGGICCAGVQTVMLGGSMYHQHYANKGTRDARVYSGEESAARIQSAATQQNNPLALEAAKTHAGNRLDAATRTSIDNLFNDAAKVEQPKVEPPKVQPKVVVQEQQLQGSQPKPQGAESGQDIELQSLENKNVVKNDPKVDGVNKQPENEIKQGEIKDGKPDSLKKEVVDEKKVDQPPAEKKDVKVAEQDKEGAKPKDKPEDSVNEQAAAQIAKHNSIIDSFKQEQANARIQFAKESAEGSVSSATRKWIETATAKVEYASICKVAAERGMDGKLVIEKGSLGSTTVADQRDAFQQQTLRDSVEARANSRSNVLTDRAARNSAYANTWTQAGYVTNMLGQGITGTIQRMREADTKSYDQSIEASRQQRETSNDLVQNSMDVFKQLLSVLSSIAESERTTFREIMG